MNELGKQIAKAILSDSSIEESVDEILALVAKAVEGMAEINLRTLKCKVPERRTGEHLADYVAILAFDLIEQAAKAERANIVVHLKGMEEA